MFVMNKKKKLIISIVIILLLIVVIASSTYAFVLARTNEGSVSTGSGMLGINYVTPDDIGGTLIPSSSRDGGLFTSTTASLKTGSQVALFNMYITPTTLTKLNIKALKWEAEGLRDTNDDGVLDVVCTGNGDFSEAVVGTPIKMINGCQLDYVDTTFNIYIWLDASILDTALDGGAFRAKIGADSVDITGTY